MATAERNAMEELGVSKEYQYGFHDDIQPTFKSRKGLDEEVINQMCDIKGEPTGCASTGLRLIRFSSRSR